MKKRSLFVATAMLLVAVLVATGATYAWFNSVQEATASVQMKVAAGSNLLISNTSGSGYKSSLSGEELDGLNDKSLTDLSTVNSELGTAFYEEEYAEDDVTVVGFKAAASTAVATDTIYFRANQNKDINMTVNVTGITGDLLEALRIGVVCGSNKSILSKTAIDGTNVTYQKAICAADANNGSTIAEGTGTQTTKAYASENVVVPQASLTTSNGYYTGDATFYFWVEGPKVNDSMIAELKTLSVTITFSQEAAE